ncbi:uncharacterized protein LOC110644486 isoform X2 [Hevea brasiliensis]|uniref:uncharacterized protein LOC110644486 isoform X2 n=1 Tax=Hevea brasiliensis TaxID=3981 RepID=UPI0025F77A95|nr:uncharacterized protein LOC110644486 isoform X2 [Hevea brasiliensis]
MKEKGQARRSWYRLSLLFMLCFHESSVFIGSKSRQEDSERKVILSAKKKFELSTFIPESSVFIGSKSGQEDSERKVILSAKKKDSEGKMSYVIKSGFVGMGLKRCQVLQRRGQEV